MRGQIAFTKAKTQKTANGWDKLVSTLLRGTIGAYRHVWQVEKADDSPRIPIRPLLNRRSVWWKKNVSTVER
jgi:hypothetical protein